MASPRPASSKSMAEMFVPNKSISNEPVSPRTIPFSMCCPITLEIMKDPVVAVDGTSYERSSIEKWYTSNSTLPVCGSTISDKRLYPNNALKIKIIQWIINNPQRIDDDVPKTQLKLKPNQDSRHYSSSNYTIISQVLSSFVNITTAQRILNIQSNSSTPRNLVLPLD